MYQARGLTGYCWFLELVSSVETPLAHLLSLVRGVIFYPNKYSIKGANDILGFEPHFSFEDGMKKTEEWWRHCRGTGLDVILAQSMMAELTVPIASKKKSSPS